MHDRDTNAASNIKAEGLSVLACGEAVRPNLHGREGRHASRKQESRSARGGIPSPDEVFQIT
jgi:putative transposase